MEKYVIEREREKKKKCTKEKLTSVTEIGNVREKLTERGKYFGVVGFKVLLCVTEPCR